MCNKRIFSSFRDPSGFVYLEDKKIYRQINRSYATAYEKAVSTGLFQSLIDNGWLLPFKESQLKAPIKTDTYKVIEPIELPFISYPYEWSFGQIKDAALLTMDIQLAALERGMLIKDASAYNIQFWRGSPVFMDHLSFDLEERHSVWPAYGQFCRHFLAPLALMSFTDVRLSGLYRVHLDGMPLDFAASLLPFKTKLRPGLLMHLHLHAKTQLKYADKGEKMHSVKKLGIKQMTAIATSLRNTVNKMKWDFCKTEWEDYYSDTNYSDTAMLSKKEIVCNMLQQASPRQVWDIGGNIGLMSRLASENGARVVSFDIDPVAVERNYTHCRKDKETAILPLVMDFTNPSPSLGFAGRERESLTSRGPADLLLVLALVHHLAISNNLPFCYLSEYFAQLGDWLLIEFVPKDDPQVRRLLTTREDIFTQYTEEHFKKAFAKYFTIVQRKQVADSKRTLYLMKKV